VADYNNPSSSDYLTMVPSFSSTITDYVVLMPYSSSGSRDIYAQGTLNSSSDTLTIDGNGANNNDWVRVSSISPGNSKSFKVDVEDNDRNKTTYNLRVVSASNSASSDSKLTSLSVSSGSSSSSNMTLSPSFSANTTSYTVDNVANNIDSIRIYADSRYAAAILVNDVLLTSSYVNVDLAVGRNDIRVVVYAEDCRNQNRTTYNIVVNRGNSSSTDSSLSSLELQTAGASSQTLNLIPGFSRSISNYTANVADGVTQVSFRPTATDSNATIRFQGAIVSSGQWTTYQTVNNGDNVFIFSVTAASGGTPTTYTVTVKRGISIVVSPQKLRVNGTEVNCAAYNINGNNYFKLRDVAFSLRGTPKHFNVTYNAATRVVNMFSNQEYSPIGGEMVVPGAWKKWQLSNQIMIIDSMNTNLTAYNIDGNNYFMLRELGERFDFGVDHNASTNYVDVNTSIGYTPDIK
jgi:hypothetical protein